MRLPSQVRRRDLHSRLVTKHTRTSSGSAPPAPDLDRYRRAVADLLTEIAVDAGPQAMPRAEQILTRRLAEPELVGVLSATPDGAAEATRELLAEARDYQSRRRSAANLAALIRIYLLSRIDVMWWGRAPAYPTDADVLNAADLVDLDALRRRGLLRFRYRRQAQTLLTRAARAAERRVWHHRAPRTTGLRFARARVEAVIMLNRLSAEFISVAPPGTPPLWVTSLVRSTQHQRRLRALGHAAMLPSSHCVGYAMDVEMSWFRRFDAHRTLQALLLERQDAGDVNVIDEGQAWHICINPVSADNLRRDIAADVGG